MVTMTSYERTIARFYYDHRIPEIENGLAVHRFDVIFTYDSTNDERYIISGDNTGPSEYYDKIEDIIDKFGKPIAIDFNNNADDFYYILKYLSDKYKNSTFRESNDLKNGKFIWDELSEKQKDFRLMG